MSANTRNVLCIVVFLMFISILCILSRLSTLALVTSSIQLPTYYAVTCCLFRWGIIILFVLLWPTIVLKIGQNRRAQPKQILLWKKEIWRIGAWLILFELLICENLIQKIIQFFG